MKLVKPFWFMQSMNSLRRWFGVRSVTLMCLIAMGFGGLEGFVGLVLW